MAFSNIVFLYFFLPLTLLCHSLVPMRWKNPVLLAASLIFFAWNNLFMLLLLPLMILVHYLLGFILERQEIDAHRRTILIIGTVLDLIPVLVQIIFRPDIPVYLAAAAAVCAIHGITYLTEVYRREVRAQTSFAALGVYLIMFPRALAGPITRYDDLRPALARRSVDTDRAADGIWRFCIGLGKKVLLADRLFALWTQVNALSSPGAASAWLGIGAFCLALWLGFSGYCDMAIGLGEMLGFDLPENFFYPLSALSLREFHRRWNATLYSWMRDHFLQAFFVQKPYLLTAAMMLSAVLTACFYGGRPALLLWGLYTGLVLVGEHHLWGKAAEKLPRFLRHITVLLPVLIGCVFFSAGTIADIGRCFVALIGLNGHGLGQAFYLIGSYWLVLLVSLLGAARWPQAMWHKLTDRFPTLNNRIRPAAILLILACCTAYMV